MANKKKRTEKKTSVIDLLPYIFIVAVVPLIVYLHIDDLDPAEDAIWKTRDFYPDLLSYCKSLWFRIASAFGLCLFAFRIIQGRVQLKQRLSLYLPSAVYIIFIILSTVTSKYASIALSGFVARYEGMLVLVFYIINMLILFNVIREEWQIQFLLKSLLVSACVISLIGLTQFAGRDFFQTGLGKSLILPAEFAESELSFNFGTMVYGTLSNPNYMGSYVALVFPIAVMIVLMSEKVALRIGAAVLSVLLLVNLVGSGSDAGLVGLGAGAIIAAVYFLRKYRKYLFRNKIIVILSVAIVLAAGGFLTREMVSRFEAESAQTYYLEDITFNKGSARIISSTETLEIRFTEEQLTFYDAAGNNLHVNVKEDETGIHINFKESAYQRYRLKVTGDVLEIRNGEVEFFVSLGEEGLRLVGIKGDEPNRIVKPEAIDVRGYEKVGSARAYIWSRTIPLLKNAVLVGYGPDTFAIVFPQNDYIGKINAYNTPFMIVDKPHNMYLQIAVNSGILSLVAFLAIIMVYIVSGIKACFMNQVPGKASHYGTGIFIGICAFLVAGLFNDSSIAVAPVFWILLGIGFACNIMAACDTDR